MRHKAKSILCQAAVATASLGAALALVLALMAENAIIETMWDIDKSSYVWECE